MTHEDVLQRASFALNGRRPQEAELLARQILKTNNRHVGALRVLGYALLNQRRFADTITLLEPLVRSQHDAEFDTQLAMALRGAGRHEDALPRLQRAVKRKPPFPRAFLELGVLQIALSQYSDAVTTLKRGAEIAPMMLDLSLQLGFVSFMVRDFEGAKAAYLHVLCIAPESADALYGVAKAYQELGEQRPAIEFFRQYLRLRPQHWATWLSLGHCLLEIGDRDGGYECFRAAARSQPDQAGKVLSSLVKAARGKFWIKPSAANRFLQDAKN